MLPNCWYFFSPEVCNWSNEYCPMAYRQIFPTKGSGLGPGIELKTLASFSVLAIGDDWCLQVCVHVVWLNSRPTCLPTQRPSQNLIERKALRHSRLTNIWKFSKSFDPTDYLQTAFQNTDILHSLDSLFKVAKWGEGQYLKALKRLATWPLAL